MTREVEKLICEAAEQLPVVYRKTSEVHRVAGHELIEQGHTEINPAEKVVAGKTYVQHMPVLIAVNHKRRMVKAYEREGQAGVIKYIQQVICTAKQQQKPAPTEPEGKVTTWLKKIFGMKEAKPQEQEQEKGEKVNKKALELSKKAKEKAISNNQTIRKDEQDPDR